MYKIGNIEIKSKVYLAPMAGVTCYAYREFMRSFGCEISVTEMVSDMGLIYDNEETNDYIKFQKTMITGVQLFGHDPENICKAAKIVLMKNPNVDFFDINMGCPVPKVTNVGSGSALMKNPSICADIVRELKKVTSLPVTAKIRLGWDNSSINFMEVIEKLQEAGVDAIGIHARTKKDLYMGQPRYDLIKDLRSKMSVPLIVSGNIYSLDDAINALNITGADAVMVARGGVGKPNLVRQINHYFDTGERLENLSLKEQIDNCLKLANMLIEEKGENRAMRLYRGIAPSFFVGFPNCKIVKSRLATELNTKEDLIRILNEFYLLTL